MSTLKLCFCTLQCGKVVGRGPGEGLECRLEAGKVPHQCPVEAIPIPKAELEALAGILKRLEDLEAQLAALSPSPKSNEDEVRRLERVARARQALEPYPGREEGIVVLLTDLMHLCTLDGLKFGTLMATARQQWNAETPERVDGAKPSLEAL